MIARNGNLWVAYSDMGEYLGEFSNREEAKAAVAGEEPTNVDRSEPDEFSAQAQDSERNR